MSPFRPSKFSFTILSILTLSTLCFATAPDRISAPIVATQTVRLAAGVPMQARPEFDQGAVDPSLKMSYMTLLTVPSASQKRALNKLLANQQNPHSAYYHKWLTPEQYADRFGLSPNDLRKLTSWLQSQGFTILRTARGRNWIVFSGTAAQVEKTFQTEIHNYEVDGETHFANTVPPTIPAALSGIVSGLRGLNNFRLKSQARRARPGYTFPYSGSNYLFLAPGDIGAIYDINTLYQNGIDGTGQTLAVIGETGIYQGDLTAFRTGFGLSAINCTTDANDIITACNTANFQYVLVNGDPTNIYGDLPEADLDIEWSGAAARNAQVIYVNATDPNGSGVVDSLYYAIDNVVSPVMTMSYTAPCELAEVGSFDADETELQLANTEGITFMNSTGDTGAAECDYGDNLAYYGYAVAYPASSPEVTGVGGTSIPAISPNEYNSTYWNSTNDSNGGSAITYIPEQAWNDAEEFGLICSQTSPPSFCTFYGITNWATAQEFIGIAAGGGGISNCVTADINFVCQSGFPQPSWQAGISASAINPSGVGVTTTPARYTPDVSLLASANFPGYIVCTEGTCASGIPAMLNACLAGTGSCTIFGGTSVSSPVFAGIVALLNQYVVANGIQDVPGLGNINPMLYSLAATPANKAFNHVTTGSTGAYSNGAWCSPGEPSNQPVALQCPNTGSSFLGFSAFNSDPTTGYNLVTGLGSVDVNNLFVAWALASLASTSTTLASSQNPQDFGSPVTFTATVTTTGSHTPSGTVTFKDGSTTLGTGTLGVPDIIIPSAQATFETSTLTSGDHSITAVYGGDSANAGSTSDMLTQTINAPTFDMTTPSAPGTVLSGQSATSTFTVTPTSSGTFAGSVTLACGGLPDATVTCSFSTNPIPAGAGPTDETLTITTSGPNSNPGRPQQHRRADNRLPWLPLTLPLAGVVVVGFAGRKVSKYSVPASLCLALGLAAFLVACGSSSAPSISVSLSGGTPIFPQNVGWTNQTETLTATVSNDPANKGVAWTVSPSLSGQTIVAADATHGTYTPPTIAAGLPGSVRVTATSVADTSKTASTSITLNPTTVPGPYGLTVIATEDVTQNSKPVTLTVN